jgi:hypothetical protein
MRRPDQDDRSEDDRSEDPPDLSAWAPVIMALIVAIVGVTASLVVLRREAARPVVGDMVVFRAGTDDRGPWRVHALVTRLGPSGKEAGVCVLNSTTMAASGGTLLVEARLPSEPTPYRVHWAGKRTDIGHGDCGASADLLMARVDLRKLATSAGGFGVRTKGIDGRTLFTDAAESP